MKIRPRFQLFIYAAITVFLLCSCGQKRSKSSTAGEKQMQEIEASALSADEILTAAMQRIGVPEILPDLPDSYNHQKSAINLAPAVRDTVAGNFRVTYCIRNNGNIVKQKDRCSSDAEIILNVQYANKDIVTKVINRDCFKSLFAGDNLSEFLLHNLEPDRFGKDFIVLRTSICIPDTDICRYYNIHIDKDGISDIVNVTSIYDFAESDTPRSVPAGVYWERLTAEEQQSVISRLPDDSDVVKYYKGEFTVSDDDRTFDLLETLSSEPEDKDAAPLYIYLLNKIAKASDGALAEVMWEYCPAVFNRNTAYMMELFRTDSKLMDEYASSIAEAIVFRKGCRERSDYVCEDCVGVLNANIANAHPDNDLRNQFIECVKRYIKVCKED